MFYGDTIEDTRQMFFTSWEKFQRKQPLLPIEEAIAQVILAHPEYHKIIENHEQSKGHTYYPEFGETNPFLHMGLHIAVREQVATNRPHGIHAIYLDLMEKYKDPLAIEHLMMDQLAECLWLSQKNNVAPDENLYLESLSALCE